MTIPGGSVKRNLAFLCATLAVYLCASPTGRAWGCRGHETVAALAEKHLTPEAKQALLAVLTANPIDPQLKRYCGERGLDPFVNSATWADDERPKEPATGPWHFIDIPLSVTSPEQVKNFCGAGGCVTRAILEQLTILRNKNALGAKRATA